MSKKICSILLLLCWIGMLSAQHLSITSVAVGDSGSVSLSWQWNGTSPSACRYDIYTSAAKSGPYVLEETVEDASQMTCVHRKAGAQSVPRYYFVCSGSEKSDTVSTLSLYMENVQGRIARLTWMRPAHTGLHPDSLPSFTLYRRGAGNDPVTVTRQTFFTDTVTVCGDTLSYVLETKVAGCRFVSPLCEDYFSDYTAPDTARLDSVSLHPQHHYCELGWQASASADVFGYIAYVYEDGIWKVLDTLYGAGNTHYIDSLHSPDQVWEYRIASIDTCRNASPLGEVHHTLHLSATTQKCDSLVHLQWNAYDHLPGGCAFYEVFVSEEGGPFYCIGTGRGAEVRHTCGGLDVMHSFVFYVRVWNADSSCSSTSSLIPVEFYRQLGSGKVYLRSVSVTGDRQLEVKAYVPDSVDFRTVILYGKKSGESQFLPLDTSVKSGNTYIWERKGLDVSHQTYLYQVGISDECEFPFAVSEVGNNILLTVSEPSDDENLLNWSSYDGFGRSPDDYTVYRKSSEQSDFELLTVLPSVVALYRDDVWKNDGKSSSYLYRVTASGSHAELPFEEECHSNTVQVFKSSTTYIPNSFIPSSAIEDNRVFRPVNLHVDATEYSFLIFDRWGQLVFETHHPDEGWDGNIDGKPARPGIYVYQLTYRIDAKNMFSRRGMVNLIR